MEDLQGAIKDYDKAIEIDPENAMAYNNRGNVKQYLRDLQGAIQDYDKAIEIDPNYATAYNNRGIAKQAQGDLQGAIQDYPKLDLDPINATVC